ncbi:Conserved_hypothetical protein [Hexamita inflata]|uniref:Uncharacterized protein n=1 Tax=Hexamita inflata TaxID=28002 RepID=A0AA86R6N9_9EUKA|nr:Conserved hypothetical protein [Hexamita inflata]
MKPNHKNKNDVKVNDKSNNSNLSEIILAQDQAMIQKYQSQIKNKLLTIKSNNSLKSLEFIKFLKINELKLQNCKNLIPKLENNTIKQLQITNCEILSVEDFYLKNLEVLEFSNNFNQLESKNLLLELVKFQQLKVLQLYGWIIDISPISQMIGLTKLSLNSCELRNVDALKFLISLKELSLFGNSGIDITSIQFLTKLTKLYLDSCGLVNLDALRPLSQLQFLTICSNNIIYIQPLQEINELNTLYAEYNKLIDIQYIEQHPYIKKYNLSKQKQPTDGELKQANVMRDVNNLVIELKQLQKKSNSLKTLSQNFMSKILESVQKQCDNHQQLFTQVAMLFQKLNESESMQ